ncbi:hypothetical protein [Clostridium tertium]|uniref:hypothetical protein n=1 Tax=Clostridium tertium TaxID=1559 RepID=UPI0024B39E45|nr:hypothetical protein [Clostridium tertium]MDI9216011.1 hypothetical protein [Clostridium tertium]
MYNELEKKYFAILVKLPEIFNNMIDEYINCVKQHTGNEESTKFVIEKIAEFREVLNFLRGIEVPNFLEVEHKEIIDSILQFIIVNEEYFESLAVRKEEKTKEVVDKIQELIIESLENFDESIKNALYKLEKEINV